jgi:uncharacterized membrane protein YphA (DoxX/SURF4 family)
LPPVLSDADAAVRRDRTATNVAIVSGSIFIVAGLVKFAFHGWELHAFRAFGLPWPSVLEIAVGGLETAGGVLLVLRLMVAPVALILALTMTVAIGVSGIGHGDILPSLTLAPVLLAAMVFLLAHGLRHRCGGASVTGSGRHRAPTDRRGSGGARG